MFTFLMTAAVVTAIAALTIKAARRMPSAARAEVARTVRDVRLRTGSYSLKMLMRRMMDDMLGSVLPSLTRSYVPSEMRFGLHPEDARRWGSYFPDLSRELQALMLAELASRKDLHLSGELRIVVAEDADARPGRPTFQAGMGLRTPPPAASPSPPASGLRHDGRTVLAVDPLDTRVQPTHTQSMEASGAMAVLDDFVPRMVSTLRSHNRVKETGILSIVGFSEQTEVLLPMTPITEAWTPAEPQLAPALTDFGPPFHEAHTQLQHMPDWTARCYRPVVFFISDGKHNVSDSSGWQAARARLVDKSFVLRPTIVALGMGDSDLPTLQTIASAPSLARHFPGEPIAALETILGIVLKSTITLSQVMRAADDDDRGYVSQIRRFRYDDDDRPGEIISWRTEVV